MTLSQSLNAGQYTFSNEPISVANLEPTRGAKMPNGSPLHVAGRLLHLLQDNGAEEVRLVLVISATVSSASQPSNSCSMLFTQSSWP